MTELEEQKLRLIKALADLAEAAVELVNEEKLKRKTAGKVVPTTRRTF